MEKYQTLTQSINSFKIPNSKEFTKGLKDTSIGMSKLMYDGSKKFDTYLKQSPYPQQLNQFYQQTLQPRTMVSSHPQTQAQTQTQPLYPQVQQPLYPQVQQPLYPQVQQPLYPQVQQPMHTHTLT